jgi:Glycosyltransferase family 87
LLLAGVLSLLGVIGYALWLPSGGLVRDGNWIGVDFHTYYTAAQVLRRGEDIYTAGISPPYVYPPLLAILLTPLALLPVDTATMLWKVLQHVCLLASGGLLVALAPRGVWPLVAGVLLFGLLAVPVKDEIRLGEVNSLVFLLVIGAVWLVARAGPDGNRSSNWLLVIAGALLGLAAAIKVLPILLIGYFWLRGPRSVAAIATGVFLLLQVGQLAVTPSIVGYWLIHFPALLGQAFPFLDNQSLNAAISRALLPFEQSGVSSVQLAKGEAVRSLVTWVVNLVVLAACIVVLWAGSERPWPRHREGYRVRLLLEVGLVVLTIHMVSGITWLHHLVDLAIPVSALLGLWWLARYNGDGVATEQQSDWGSLWLPCLLLGAVALLVIRPEEWLGLLAGSGVEAPLILWWVSNLALWVVAGLWVLSAAAIWTAPRVTARVPDLGESKLLA